MVVYLYFERKVVYLYLMYLYLERKVVYLYFKRKVVMRSAQEEEVPLPGPHSAHKVPPPLSESPNTTMSQKPKIKYSQEYLPKDHTF